MVEHSKRKKFHDKDKYYRLAKEQGLRSRAAFKLSQINRKYPVLVQKHCQNAVLDLCAAPGGWTQIAARTCAASVPIVAVDVLPIRSLGRPNVTTIVGDITTDKCKSDIQRALLAHCKSQQQQRSNNNNKNSSSNNNTQIVDLVLHDGAPNVGADYGKDAYEQNELVLHAVRTATQHLRRGGSFVTKVYRSRDYAALLWVLRQLWDDVAACKPAASRPQSAEIFLVCSGYKAPTKVDAALTDPRRVFAHVDGATTGGGNNNPQLTGNSGSMTVLHKNWDKPRRRRGGYDLDHLDFAMRHTEPAFKFVDANFKDAVQLLSASTGLAFHCEQCRDGGGNKNETQPQEQSSPGCRCSFLLHHPLTTPEIKACVSDLQLLNKSDFKGLLHWRTQMQDALAEQRNEQHDDDTSQASSNQHPNDSSDEENEQDSETEEAAVQSEIAELRRRRQRERKRRQKKERAAAAKRRKRAALGMDLSAIDVAAPEEHDRALFSLRSFRGELPSEVDLDRVTDEQLFGRDGDSDNEDDVVVGGGSSGSDDDDSDGDDEEARARRRERDLDEAYNEYLQNTKDGTAKTGTKMAKRSKKVQRQKIVAEAQEDQEMALTGAEHIAHDARAYAKLLQRGQGGDDSDDGDDSSSSDDDDDDDGFDAKPMTPGEHERATKKKAAASQQASSGDDNNPLIHKFADEPTSVKTARWFSNPLFANLSKAAEVAAKGNALKQDDSGGSESSSNQSGSDESDDDDDSSVDEDDGEKATKKRDSSNNKKKKKKVAENSITAEDVLASMPKTDKQIRHEKRLKALDREQRKKTRREKKLGTAEGEFQLVAAAAASDSEDDDDDDDDDNAQNKSDEKLEHLSDAQKKKVLEARELIKAGLGNNTQDEDAKMEDRGIEIVSQEETTGGPLPVMDKRKYDSDHEDYDSDDYARTLALGTMMLRRSKEKAFVDASYNRYAWNDPEGLPDWFVDDENKHYRPQLPIPPALVAKMKEKMMALSTKPIAKVAEARARKSKRARAKLAAAKKQAEAVANSSEMSEAMKLKAISKALQGQESTRPGKKYVVAKKGRGGKGVKGAKLVDKRLKNDKRATSRIEKKRKKGKQNGLVGSKRRRHHS